MSTPALVWALCGLGLTLGLVLIYAGTRPVSPDAPTGGSPGLARFKTAATMRLSRTEQVILGVAFLAALVVAILTGWVIALVLFPMAGLFFPRLLAGRTNTAEIERLDALQEWTRALAGVLTTSTGLKDSLMATLRSTPAPIKPEVELLVARLQAGRPAPQALWAFADDLDDPAGDLIASTLILGASRSGAGLTKVLGGLASAVDDEVRVRRTIETTRSSPRKEARIITMLFPIMFVGFLTFTGFGTAYTTPIGQAVLLVLVSGFFACLFWMHWLTVAKPEPRFLVSTTTGAGAR